MPQAYTDIRINWKAWTDILCSLFVKQPRLGEDCEIKTDSKSVSNLNRIGFCGHLEAKEFLNDEYNTWQAVIAKFH